MIMVLSVLRSLLILVEIAAVIAVTLLILDFTYFLYEEAKEEKRRKDGRHHKSEIDNIVAEIKYFVFEMRFIEFKEAAKAQLRKQKEASAEGGFFEEPFVRGFDTTGQLQYRGEHRFPTPETAVLVKKMDDVLADQIFENIEGF